MEKKTQTEARSDSAPHPDAEAYSGTDAHTDTDNGAQASTDTDTDTDTEMIRPFIVLRDKTTHGGVVITASENTFTDDRRVARIGDLVLCPIQGHGVNPIVTASPYVEIDGRRVARHHDLTACGSLLLSSQLESSSE